MLVGPGDHADRHVGSVSGQDLLAALARQHLEPEQVRVIPTPCPCPGTAPVPRAGPGTLRIQDNASRYRHAAQQTPSAAANHAPGARVSHRPWTPTPRHTISEYLRRGSCYLSFRECT